VTNKSSFEKVQEWVQSVYDNTERSIQMVLVGNKIDLNREVSTDEGKKLADFYKIPFFETSAKDNIGISDCLKGIINRVLENQKKPDIDTIKLNNEESQKSGCSC
jgi:GTPase SAR1 family protein